VSKAIEIEQELTALLLSARNLQATRRLVSYVEAASYALLRRRILSAIAICSIVWLASLWLAAALAQAQESPSNNSGLSVTQSAQPSLATTEASHIVLSKVDRSDLDLSTLPNSATEVANPQATDQHSAEKVLLPSNPRGTEFASLAALVSAPSSSLLNAIQAKGPGKTDTGSAASDKKTLVYQVGAVNFVINGFPNSFSVSTAGSSVAGAR